jgi:hypothetical protein
LIGTISRSAFPVPDKGVEGSVQVFVIEVAVDGGCGFEARVAE